jgi:hypothetical protein
VVADDEVGVTIVSVEEGSQAFQAELRPEDVIVQAHGREIRSIEDFAALSAQLKGQASETTLVLFRHGTPRQVRLHLYSYPLLRAWQIEFIPDHDLRFAQARTGLAYWSRLGRGFEHVGNEAEALNAYLNGLHNDPEDQETALKVIRLHAHVGEARLARGSLAEGLASLQQALTMMERFFEFPLSEPQLAGLRDQLRATVEALRQARPGLTDRRPSSMVGSGVRV